MDSNGFSDPYVKMTLLKETKKSKTIKKTLDPVWNESFTWKGVLKDLIAEPMQLHAWDYDFGSKDDPLGFASIALTPLENVKFHNVAAPLDVQGTVFLRFGWQADGDAPPPAAFREPHQPSQAPPVAPPQQFASPPSSAGLRGGGPPSFTGGKAPMQQPRGGPPSMAGPSGMTSPNRSTGGGGGAPMRSPGSGPRGRPAGSTGLGPAGRASGGRGPPPQIPPYGGGGGGSREFAPGGIQQGGGGGGGPVGDDNLEQLSEKESV